MKKSILEKKSNSAITKRIYNSITGSYYSVRVRSTNMGKKGTIIGKWSSAMSKKEK